MNRFEYICYPQNRTVRLKHSMLESVWEEFQGQLWLYAGIIDLILFQNLVRTAVTLSNISTNLSLHYRMAFAVAQLSV